MKNYILLIVLAIAMPQFTYSQKVQSDNINNGVRRIQSKSEEIDFDNLFRYNLEKFIFNGASQYFIRGRSEENKYHNFPYNCKLLFKTFDGEVIQLTSVISELAQIDANVWEPTAYYPITKEQLNMLFNGISKIRVEMLSYNKKDKKPFMDYPEMSFKKDKIGKQFKEMFDIIEKKELSLSNDKLKEEKKKKGQGTSLERENATDGF